MASLYINESLINILGHKERSRLRDERWFKIKRGQFYKKQIILKVYEPNTIY